MNVQSLLESANPWTDRQNEASKLVGKWESTGLLKNLANEYDRNNMSVILENQARSLVQEANITGGTTSMSGGAGENWAGVALPLVRRVFGEIVAPLEIKSKKPLKSMRNSPVCAMTRFSQQRLAILSSGGAVQSSNVGVA